MFGEVLGNVEDPDNKVRQVCFCVYAESDLKYKGLTFCGINFALKLSQAW